MINNNTITPQTSNEPVIRVTNLTKIYPLYNNPRNRLKEALDPRRKSYHNDFYALHDVSFEVEKGETIGIIGQNGSGKSTLLKIISNVLTPSAGSCMVKGKVSSLLELGTGFNPELTGLENVFFYGTLLGFTKEEMEEKLDSILNFADIGEFVKQPVKTYSSGMYVRLAFAVAVHVEPDILIIDEALAVGDMRFQQKCFRKINEFREQGKTIIFCSHDTNAILNFCTVCAWLDDGRVKELGDPAEIVQKYLAWVSFEKEVKKSTSKSNNTLDTENKTNEDFNKIWNNIDECARFGDMDAEIVTVALYYDDFNKVTTVKGGEKVNLAIKVLFKKDLPNTIIGFTVKNRLGEPAFGTNTYAEKFPVKPHAKNSTQIFIFSFNMPFLGNNQFSIDISVATGTQEEHIQHCWVYDAVAFNTNNKLYKASFGFVFIPNNNMEILQIK